MDFNTHTQNWVHKVKLRNHHCLSHNYDNIEMIIYHLPWTFNLATCYVSFILFGMYVTPRRQTLQHYRSPILIRIGRLGPFSSAVSKIMFPSASWRKKAILPAILSLHHAIFESHFCSFSILCSKQLILVCVSFIQQSDNARRQQGVGWFGRPLRHDITGWPNWSVLLLTRDGVLLWSGI